MVFNPKKTPQFENVASEIYLNFEDLPESGQEVVAIHTNFHSPPLGVGEIYEYKNIDGIHHFYTDLPHGTLIYSSTLRFLKV